MSLKPSDSFTIRAATLEDEETLLAQRRAMFFDIGYQDPQVLDTMASLFRIWLRQKMQTGEYRAWLVVAPDSSVAAGAGLWLMDWPPMVFAMGSPRANILNVYTQPENRRQGLARRLMTVILDWCRENRIQAVILHASDEGRPLYESLGFRPTKEMRLMLGED